MDASELPVVYQITGHGESSLSGGFTEAVEKANITLSQLTLLKEESIPEDAEAIIINGPTSDFSTDDTEKVLDYLKKGGKAIITCNFEHQGLENFESVLKEYGLGRVSGIIMENDRNYYYGDRTYYLLPMVESTDYTASVKNKYIFAPYSEGISYPEDTEDTVYTVLLQTSTDAVSKVDVANATTSKLEDGDIAGPFAVAVAAQKNMGDDVTSDIVVIGSSMLLTDDADQIVSGSNVSMFTDILSALTGDSDLSLSVIASKAYTLSNLTVSAGTGYLVATGMMVVDPFCLLAAGIVIWVIRRMK